MSVYFYWLYAVAMLLVVGLTVLFYLRKITGLTMFFAMHLGISINVFIVISSCIGTLPSIN